MWSPAIEALEPSFIPRGTYARKIELEVQRDERERKAMRLIAARRKKEDSFTRFLDRCKSVVGSDRDGRIVCAFQSECEAAACMKLSRTAIRNSIKNGFTSGGLAWAYFIDGRLISCPTKGRKSVRVLWGRRIYESVQAIATLNNVRWHTVYKALARGHYKGKRMVRLNKSSTGGGRKQSWRTNGCSAFDGNKTCAA